MNNRGDRAGEPPPGGTGEGVRFYPRGDLRLRTDIAGAAFWAVRLERVMLTYFEVQPRVRFDRHSHEAEQITMVLEGALTFEYDGAAPVTVGPGEAIAIPSWAPHAVVAGPAGAKAIDTWSPPHSRYAAD